jgi:hypothetical protein
MSSRIYNHATGMHEDASGTRWTGPGATNNPPPPSGTQVTIHHSDGTKSSGHMVGGTAIRDKSTK